MQKVDEALIDVEKGNFYTHDEIKEYTKKWLKKVIWSLKARTDLD